MKYCQNDFDIIYNECDIDYIDNLIEYFKDKKQMILKFFEINELRKKLIIKLYGDISEYSSYRNNNLLDTSVGNMDFDDNCYYINILSYKEFIKRKGHKNDSLDYYFKTIMHEFVHICHEEIGTYKKTLIWLREGIAIVLSKQYDGLNYKIDNCTLDILISDKRTWYINYYSLVDYTIKKYGLDYIMNLILNPNIQKEETIKIYNEFISNYDK